MIEAMRASGHNYVVIYPNNDLGAEMILDAYKPLHDFPNFKIFPSMRLEYFLTLLRNARYIIGNSSAGIHEAPVYGVRTINIANRQQNRFCHESIHNVPSDSQAIISAIQESDKLPACTPSFHFGTGNSSKLFMNAINDERLWKIQKQKQFIDI
jgi:UDP-N-acetylglucosamine 2-epimerase (hydrolysing)